MISQTSFVFGIETDGLPVDEAARRSSEKYVRSEAELGLYEEFRNPTGHILTAWEAYTAFGADTLEEAVEWGAAILRETPNATGDALKGRRKALNLSHKSVARAALVKESDVRAAETAPRKVHINKLDRIAFALGLDERFLAFKKDMGGDAKLAYRLRERSKPP